jgi:chromosome partitioning protein
LPLPFLGVLRETQAYVRCAERGLTLFDLPPARVQHDLRQWQPILDWLAPVLSGQRGATTVGPLASPLTMPRANIAARVPMPRPTQPATAPATLAARLGRLIETLAVPRFLQRN